MLQSRCKAGAKPVHSRCTAGVKPVCISSRRLLYYRCFCGTTSRAAGCSWLQLVAAGCSWLQLVAAGCSWLQLVAACTHTAASAPQAAPEPPAVLAALASPTLGCACCCRLSHPDIYTSTPQGARAQVRATAEAVPPRARPRGASAVLACCICCSMAGVVVIGVPRRTVVGSLTCG